MYLRRYLYLRTLNEKTELLLEVRSYVFTKAIHKRKKRHCAHRTFCEYLAASLPLRMFLAPRRNVNLRRFVRTIYRSLGRLLFEHSVLLLFRVFCIGFESWL